MATARQNDSPKWSSNLAFILAAVGSSVGLGNLWRFSAEAGANGGGAFIVIYLACVLAIGIPTILGEFIIGRAGRATSAINSAGDLAKRSNSSLLWSSGAWLGTVSSFLIVSFYGVVAAWVLAYIQRFANNAFDGQTAGQIAQQFDLLIVSPTDLIGYFLAFTIAVIWFAARGVNKGLELASKTLMPAFFFLLLALSLFSMYTAWDSGGTAKAFTFMFSFDFSRITPVVAVNALGQAFFSLGLGMAVMITYGSYLPGDVSLPRSAFTVGFADTAVALIAGLSIFPIVFQHGLEFDAGSGLFFQTLPMALLATPGGNVIGASFFCMALFAALTTAVSLLEPAVSHLTETLNLKRTHSAVIIGSAMIVVGALCLFDLGFLDFLDKGLTAPILLPLSSLLVVLFVGHRLSQSILKQEFMDRDVALAKILTFLLKYPAPLMIILIMVAGISEQYL